MRTKFNGILTLLLALFVQISFAQDKTISGTVSDESGPLPGVTVIKKGTTQGTETDFNGKYSIKTKTGDVLVFSFVGMKTIQKTIGVSNSIDVVMSEDSNILEEVVVTAYGIKRKPDELTVSNQVVKADKLVQANAQNLATALVGKVSGLDIRQTSSGVGADNFTVNLRGLRSFSGNNEALVVIDGVPSSLSFFFTLDPNTIESVNVLKGASGAALYGPRGANGLIVVTTVKGSGDDKFSINVKSSVDIESLAYLPVRQTRYGQGWASGGTFQNFIYENGAWGPEFDGQLSPVGYPLADGTQRLSTYETLGSDNIAPFFKDGTTIYNGVNINGGDQDSGYYNLAISNTNREFIIKDDTNKRTSVSIGAGKKFNKLNLGVNIQYVTNATRSAGGTLYRDLLHTATNIDITQFTDPSNETHWNGYFYSPYWKKENIRNFNNSSRINSNLKLGYEINDNISVRSTVSANFSDIDRYNYNNGYTDPASIAAISGFTRTLSSSYSNTIQAYKQYYADLITNLKYDLSENWGFDSNVGITTTDEIFNLATVSGTGLAIPGLYNISNLTTLNPADDLKRRTRSFSAFGDATVNYKDYLFFNATARIDLLSKLAPENRDLFYPSVGVSFVPTKAFDSMKNDWLDRLKMSYSYVASGNAAAISAYDINDVYVQSTGVNYGTFPLGGLSAFIPQVTATDPLLKPEFLTAHEFNIIAEFLKRRITLDVSGYFGNNTDQIAEVSTSFASGLTNNVINIGEAETSGFEIDLGLTPIKNDNWNWNLNASYATNKMVVTKVSDQTSSVQIGGGTGVGIFAEEGQEFPLIKGQDYERDPNGHVIIGADGNPTRTTDLKSFGRTTPKHTFGLSSNLKFKNLSLNVVADYRTGHVFYSGTKSQLSWSGHLVESAENGRKQFIFPNSVIETAPGVFTPNTSIPTGGPNDSAYLNYYSNIHSGTASNHILDATAFKVREISLSYNFSKKTLESLGLTAFKISANARNPFTVLSNENKGYADPEASNSNTARTAGLSTVGNYPSTRTLGFSIDLTF